MDNQINNENINNETEEKEKLVIPIQVYVVVCIGILLISTSSPTHKKLFLLNICLTKSVLFIISNSIDAYIYKLSALSFSAFSATVKASIIS